MGLDRDQVPDDLLDYFEQQREEVRVGVIHNFHPT